MLQPQLSDQKVGEGEYAGLGFFCVGKDESFFFGHGGWDEGFIALMQQPPLPLLPTSDREFFSRTLNTTIAFEHTIEGHITGLTIHQDGTTITAKR